MKAFYVVFFLVVSWLCGYAQAPANDDCGNAVALPSGKSFCSNDGQYTTAGSTPSFQGSGNDVWFTFTPRDGYDLFITVYGAGNGGTLQAPVIRMFTDCTFSTGLVGSSNSSNNVTTLYEGGLQIGKTYYFNVSGSNSGTFKVCYQNQNSPVKAGQDCATAKYLCSMEQVRETNISGPGAVRDEGAGTCMDNGGQASETNSTWFKWQAANSGTLVFTITPTVVTDDLDWVLFDLGATDNCNNKSAVACADGSGVTCTGAGYYYKTGLDFNSSDVREAAGCVAGQDGKVRYVDMIMGHTYALMINNPYQRGNGFTIDFTDQNGKAGTGKFVGPEAVLDFKQNNPCTASQSFTFTSLSTNSTSLKWNFGEGANIPSATGAGPYTITYSTPGHKTVVLEAHGDNICYTLDTKSFNVALKPATPTITPNQSKYCLNDDLVLSTPVVQNATYSWTGPNGFSSDQRVVTIPLKNYQAGGPYVLAVTVDNCTSDPSSITVPIGKTPVVNFDITENAPCTTSQSFTFTNRSSDYQKVSWNFGAGASLASSTTDQAFTITYSSPGTKTITLQEESSEGCVVTLTKTLLVSRIPPTPSIQSNKPDFCLKDVINLSTDELPNTIYSWTGPNNFASDQPSVSIPVTSFAVSGTYTLVITQDKCSSAPVSVTIPPILKNPTAAFRADPPIPAKLSFPVAIDFFNESTDADSYLWDFGDGFTSTNVDPSHEYTKIGDYDISLIAFKSDVCEATVTHGKLVIRAQGAIFIPNTFTPNGDGVNDEFVVSLTNLRSYHIKIFNRWGEQLFESSSIFENWNGLYNGAPLPVGTYYYVIDAVEIKRNPIRRSGSVTIIR